MKESPRHFVIAACVAVLVNGLLLSSIVWLNRVMQPETRDSNIKQTHFRLEKTTPENPSPLSPPSTFRAASTLSLALPKLSLPSAIAMSRTIFDEWESVTTMGDLSDGLNSNDLVFKEDAVDKQAQLLSRATPRYPRVAQRQGLGGTVTFRIVVGRDGSVEKVDLLGATPAGIFEASAEAAIRQYRYTPALMDGKPVRSFYRQKIIFRLRD